MAPDPTTVETASLVVAIVSTTVLILSVVIPKRKDLRNWVVTTRVRLIQRLDRKAMSNRGVIFLILISAGTAAYATSKEGDAALQTSVSLFLLWFFIAIFVLGSRVERQKAPHYLTEIEVEKIVDDKLKQPRT